MSTKDLSCMFWDSKDNWTCSYDYKGFSLHHLEHFDLVTCMSTQE